MKIENIYVKGCIALVATVLLWGWLAPVLISSPTDAGVAAGIVVALFVPVLDYWIIKSIIKTVKTLKQTETDEKN